MKYICIISTSGVGGIWSVVRYSLPLFRKHYDVSVIVYTKKHNLQSEVIKYLESINVKYLIINFNVQNGWLFDICKALNIKKALKFIGEGPAIVHCQDSFLSGSVLPFLKDKRYSLFSTIHGAMFDAHSFGDKVRGWINKNVRCRLLEKSGVTIISCDPQSIPILHQYFPRTETIHLAVNGVPAAIGISADKPCEPFIIGFMSRFHPLKRWDLVAQSAEELFKEGYNIRIVFAGSGEECENIMNWCNNHKEYAVFMGNVKNVSESLLPQVNLHVLPTQYPEGLPMIILESMAAGIPTITTSAGSCAFAIEDGINGFVIEPQVDLLVEKLKQLIDNRELYHNMSNNARKIWGERFSDTSMVEQYVSIFSSFVQS